MKEVICSIIVANAFTKHKQVLQSLRVADTQDTKD